MNNRWSCFEFYSSLIFCKAAAATHTSRRSRPLVPAALRWSFLPCSLLTSHTLSNGLPARLPAYNSRSRRPIPIPISKRPISLDLNFIPPLSHQDDVFECIARDGNTVFLVHFPSMFFRRARSRDDKCVDTYVVQWDCQ